MHVTPELVRAEMAYRVERARREARPSSVRETRRPWRRRHHADEPRPQLRGAPSAA